MFLFRETIENWSDWGKVFQSIPAFAPLVDEILRRESLPSAQIENLTPGTNAVFRIGGYVVKIFSPKESGIDGAADMETELFATKFAHDNGVNAPKIVADGEICDKCDFKYLVMSFERGVQFGDAVGSMSDDRKRAVGRELRRLTDRMDIPCERFNRSDPLDGSLGGNRWEKFSERFKNERISRISTRNYGESVFVHGDLNPDNILIDGDGSLTVLDFADALCAPICYEHALVASELFLFDNALLHGFFGEYDPKSLTNLILDGLLIHAFGGDVIAQRVCPPSELDSLDDLYRKLLERVDL